MDRVWQASPRANMSQLHLLHLLHLVLTNLGLERLPHQLGVRLLLHLQILLDL